MNITLEFVQDGLKQCRYITTLKVETAVYLALVLEKPLLIEGPAGVGKTEVAKVLAELLQTELVRLQCYEGLDEARALYEWNYQKQLLRIQTDAIQNQQNQHSQQTRGWDDISGHIFSHEYLLERPLLHAIRTPHKVVLLIDEIDKADEEFEAFLLEILSDFQVSVPELGTLQAIHRPAVILTSNRARELSEALKRRCLHLYIDFPGMQAEAQIIALKVPDLEEQLRHKVARFISSLRKLDLKKSPSISETLDWARALLALGVKELDSPTVKRTLNLVLKYEEDIRKAESKVGDLLR